MSNFVLGAQQQQVSFMLYVFFWVIPRRLYFICRRFGTLFHIHRQVGACRMNSAWDMFGVLYGKRFGSEMAWAIRTEGERLGGPSRVHSTRTYLPMKMEQSVPKRRHIKFRRRGITQKKAYNIQDAAEVWNQSILQFTGLLNKIHTIFLKCVWSLVRTVFISSSNFAVWQDTFHFCPYGFFISYTLLWPHVVFYQCCKQRDCRTQP